MKEHGYTEGDWIVHQWYGVGRIRGIEKKNIAGQEKDYFHIVTQESEFWVPVDPDQDTRVRRLVSPKELKTALETLQETPVELPKDYRQRQQVIREARSDGSLDAICKIIRDLSARRKRKSLNEKEKGELSFLRGLLLKEWSKSEAKRS